MPRCGTGYGPACRCCPVKLGSHHRRLPLGKQLREGRISWGRGLQRDLHWGGNWGGNLGGSRDLGRGRSWCRWDNGHCPTWRGGRAHRRREDHWRWHLGDYRRGRRPVFQRDHQYRWWIKGPYPPWSTHGQGDEQTHMQAKADEKYHQPLAGTMRTQGQNAASRPKKGMKGRPVTSCRWLIFS